MGYRQRYKVLGSTLGQDINYPDQVFMAFLSPSKQIPRQYTSIWPWMPLPSKSLKIYHSPISLPFVVGYSFNIDWGVK
jgi:hypothetical protein